MKIAFYGDNIEEVLTNIDEFVTSVNAKTAGKSSAEEKKTRASGKKDEEEKPAKKKVEEITDDVLRAKAKQIDPVEHAKATIKKFGYAGLPDVPQNERADLIAEFEKVAEMSTKERKKYLDLDDEL